ncbi:hypothetical protein ABZZ74_17085 [Streptomyces sp. NPDC006476]|uniref:hypothetical protein n=1 Tax=Streptomyces sp. NPDC006476 TaxID=3157175 RepID=UPI0033B4B743
MTLLPTLPQNTALLDLLRKQGVPQEDRNYGYEAWELHTHPDLLDRLADLGPHWPVLATFGVPVLATKDIAAVVARGTSALLVRLPEAPSEPLVPVSGMRSGMRRACWRTASPVDLRRSSTAASFGIRGPRGGGVTS